MLAWFDLLEYPMRLRYSWFDLVTYPITIVLLAPLVWHLVLIVLDFLEYSTPAG